jgi:hypothetical protein
LLHRHDGSTGINSLEVIAVELAGFGIARGTHGVSAILEPGKHQ